MKPYQAQLGLSVALAFGYALANVGVLPLVQQLVDQIASQNLNQFNLSLGLACLLMIARLLTRHGQGFLTAWVGYRISADIRTQIYHRLTASGFQGVSRTGDFMSRIFSDSGAVRDLLRIGFRDILPSTLTLFGVLGFLIWKNWVLSLVVLVELPLYLAIAAWMGPIIRRISGRIRRKEGVLAQIFVETLTHTRLIQTYGLEHQMLNRFNADNNRIYQSQIKATTWQTFFEPILEFVQFGVMVGIFWVGGFLVVTSQMTGADFASFAFGLFLLAEPVIMLSRVYTQSQEAHEAAARIFAILDQKTNIQAPRQPVHLSSVSGKITFENVSFAYPSQPNQLILDSINFTVNPGQTIRLVGPSGAGKSSLVSLIPRFYDPTSGRITLDGVDLKDLDLVFLRSQIGAVMQDDSLFQGTIEENIQVGRLSASRSELIDAARKANAWEFIEKMPGQLGSRVGERGTKLSVGQRQRISIARALLKNPAILILDEATSALDPESEQLVQAAIVGLMRGRTVFIIAHKPENSIKTDLVLTLDKKKNEASGFSSSPKSTII